MNDVDVKLITDYFKSYKKELEDDIIHIDYILSLWEETDANVKEELKQKVEMIKKRRGYDHLATQYRTVPVNEVPKLKKPKKRRKHVSAMKFMDVVLDILSHTQTGFTVKEIQKDLKEKYNIEYDVKTLRKKLNRISLIGKNLGTTNHHRTLTYFIRKSREEDVFWVEPEKTKTDEIR
ncbi:MAG: hypothetical protein M0R03_11495 [Novosphingobium sp.]|nr:hypothetical protein [Novosphingobium sp.]